MAYALEDLLTEVNKVASAASSETLREPVTHQLKHVYKRVGAEALFYPGVLVIEPTQNQFVELPDTLIKLIGVYRGRPGKDHGIIKTINRYGQMVTGEVFLDYEYRSERIYFNEGMLREPITVTYWSMPVDRRGVPLIDDHIWQAAILYCQAEVARINLHFNNKQSFSGLPYQVDTAAANREMDAARADCNSLAEPDFIKLLLALNPVRSSGSTIVDQNENVDSLYFESPVSIGAPLPSQPQPTANSIVDPKVSELSIKLETLVNQANINSNSAQESAGFATSKASEANIYANRSANSADIATEKANQVLQLAQLVQDSLRIRRHDYVSPFSYIGIAPAGSSESASVSTIIRIQVTQSGLTIKTKAVNVAWISRLTAIYSS